MPGRRRAPSGWGPQARWLHCSLLTYYPAWLGLRTQFSSLAPYQRAWGPAAKWTCYYVTDPYGLYLADSNTKMFSQFSEIIRINAPCLLFFQQIYSCRPSGWKLGRPGNDLPLLQMRKVLLRHAQQ